MKLVKLDKIEFNKLANNFACKNFFQTSYMGDSLELRRKKVYYLGLECNGKIMAATLLVEGNTFFKKKTFIALKGFLIDYNNQNLIKEFTINLLKFIKKNNGFKLIIDPYIIEVERDIDGKIVANGKNNYAVINSLKKMGFVKTKNNTQVKYNFCLDLANKTEEEIFRNFKASTRNIINKSIREGVEIIDLKKDELKEFKKITEDTCKRRGFADKTMEYYQSMYDAFKNLVVFKLARLNIKKYLDYLNMTKQDYLEKCNNIKGNNKKKDNYLLEINNINKKIEKAKSLPIIQGYVNLASAMFMLYGDETIYLFSGSYDELNEFGGQYLIQWDIIKYAIQHGYKRHNFFGIMNFDNKKDKNYGIYLFKRGFNGYVEELLGEYAIYTKDFVGLLAKIKDRIR